MTNKLEPCRCGVVPTLVGEAYYHPVMPVSQCFFRGKWIEAADREQWNTLMSTTSARKEGARLGIEAAAKWHDAEEACFKLLATTSFTQRGTDQHTACEQVHRESASAIRSINIDDLVKP